MQGGSGRGIEGKKEVSLPVASSEPNEHSRQAELSWTRSDGEDSNYLEYLDACRRTDANFGIVLAGTVYRARYTRRAERSCLHGVLVPSQQRL